MSIRQARLSDQIRDIISGCFMADGMNDPRLKGVNITAVDVTADLQLAKVYFRLFEDSEPARIKAIAGLESASSKFRRLLGKELDLRRVPELRFYFDESIEHGAAIETLLAKLRSGDA